MWTAALFAKITPPTQNPTFEFALRRIFILFIDIVKK